MAPSLKLVQQFVALPALSPSMWPDGSGGGVVLFPHLVVCTSHDFSRSVLRFLSLSPKLAVQSVIEGFLKRTYMKRI